MLRMLSAPEPREDMPRALDLIEDADDVSGLEFADLQIAASGDVGAARTPVGSYLREPAQLVSGEHGARNAEAKHEGILRRGDVEKAVELEAKEIVGSGGFVFVRVREELVPDVEGVLFVFPALLFAQIGDGSAEVRLFRRPGCLVDKTGGGVAGDASGGGVADEGDWAALDGARKEALEILLLFCGKTCRIDCGLGFGFHAGDPCTRFSDTKTCREVRRGRSSCDELQTIA